MRCRLRVKILSRLGVLIFETSQKSRTQAAMDETPCPSSQELIDFCIGKSGEQNIEALTRHLDLCASCRQTVEALERVPIPFVEYYLSRCGPEQPRTAVDPQFREMLAKLKQLRGS